MFEKKNNLYWKNPVMEQGKENSILEKMLADIRAWAAEKMESLQSMNMKRLLLMNLPYAAAVYIFDKSAWLYRHCLGECVAEKAGVLFMNLSVTFEDPFPSLYPRDLLIRAAGAALVKTAVYMKGKNAKNSGTVRNTAPQDGGRRKTLRRLSIRF